MKFCMKCGAKLPDDAEFCGECGTRQPKLEEAGQAAPPQPAADAPKAQPSAAPSAPKAADLGAIFSGMSFMDKLGYLGAILVAVGAFLPMVSIAGFVNLSLSDVSKGLMVVLLVCGIGSGVLLFRGVREVLAPVGTGLLVTILCGLFKYFSLLNEAKKSFFGSMAGSAVKLDWGFYILLIGTLLLIFAGILAKLHAKDQAISGSALAGAWKDCLVEPVKIEGVSIPGWAVAVIVLALLIIIFSQADPMKGMKW